MKPTAAASYALRALTHLAAQGVNAPMASRGVAQVCQLPENYLLKVLAPLVRAGLLYSVKGPNGGYRLARPANQITLLEIVEAADGPVRGEAPEVEGAAGLNRRLVAVCDAAADATRKELGKVRLSDLAGPD
jgi:Rrf2 family protein